MPLENKVSRGSEIQGVSSDERNFAAVTQTCVSVVVQVGGAPLSLLAPPLPSSALRKRRVGERLRFLLHALQDSPLILQSDRNVTVNARNDLGHITGRMTVGSEMVEAQCQRFEVRSSDGQQVLFSADEQEVSIGAEKLRVTGTEGAVFEHSVETPHVRAEPFQDLKLESPTRTLTMEAPRGVEMSADVGDLKATCRKELLLQSTDGEVWGGVRWG
ncbi:hypothetical protein Z043_107526 [Scleropages formosus]|uniref:Zeta-sarcoglycan-like n=1 Tax=Scleropages formosus TaxID=113540 RepID=A0A0P7VDL1_SCLFO|nr:hypothetical protein Z043_107526 [Scleropages formosus]